MSSYVCTGPPGSPGSQGLPGLVGPKGEAGDVGAKGNWYNFRLFFFFVKRGKKNNTIIKTRLGPRRLWAIKSVNLSVLGRYTPYGKKNFKKNQSAHLYGVVRSRIISFIRARDIKLNAIDLLCHGSALYGFIWLVDQCSFKLSVWFYVGPVGQPGPPGEIGPRGFKGVEGQSGECLYSM